MPCQSPGSDRPIRPPLLLLRRRVVDERPHSSLAALGVRLAARGLTHTVREPQRPATKPLTVLLDARKVRTVPQGIPTTALTPDGLASRGSEVSASRELAPSRGSRF